MGKASRSCAVEGMSSLSFGMVAALLFLAAAYGARAQAAPNQMAIHQSRLCVTEGAVEAAPGDRLSVETAKMRAYVNAWTSQSVETRFTYLGPTAEESRLGSGAVRRQFGLKLRAQNACNLVYVMWRFEPKSRIVVSVKRNPDQTASSQCGNHGYQNIKPDHSHPVPPVLPGSEHDLGAEMRGTAVKVTVDGKAVWDGDVGPEAADLEGPVGIRSDNVRLGFDLEAGQAEGVHPHFIAACKSGPGVSD